MSYVSYGLINIYSPGNLALMGTGQYRCLRDHWMDGPAGRDEYYPAGTIMTEGVEIPFGWFPTLAVDPLNTTAAARFYAAGPRDLVTAPSNDLDWGMMTLPPPVTFWVEVRGPGLGTRSSYINYGFINILTVGQQLPDFPGKWRLTGLGANYPPRLP